MCRGERDVGEVIFWSEKRKECKEDIGDEK